MTTSKIIENECYTREQLAAHFGIGVNAVSALAKDGLIPFVLNGTRPIFPIKAVEEFEQTLGRMCGEAYAKKILEGGNNL